MKLSNNIHSKIQNKLYPEAIPYWTILSNQLSLRINHHLYQKLSTINANIIQSNNNNNPIYIALSNNT